MGAIVGALYAGGWNADRIDAYAHNFDIKHFLENPAFRLPEFALSRILRAGAAMGALASGKALDSGSRVLAEFERLFEQRNFEDLPTPFVCVTADLASGEQRLFDSGPLATAVRASMSFPGIFSPLAMGDELLVDGGILNNLPCSVAHDRGYHRILASDVSPFKHMVPSRLTSGINILLRSFDIAAEHAQKHSASIASLRIVSDGALSAFDFEHIDAAIQMGRYAARNAEADILGFFGRRPSRMQRFLAKLFTWKPSPDRSTR